MKRTTIRKPIIAIAAVAALLSASLPAASQASAASASQQQEQWIQQVKLNGEERGLSYPLKIESGKVWIAMDDTASLLMEYRREYDAKKGTIAFTNPWRRIELKLGSKTATMNGTKVTLTAAPAKKEGTVYLPTEVLSQLLKAQVTWNAKTYTLSIQYAARALATSWTDYFWVDKVNGDLYKAAPGQRAVSIGRTTADVSHAQYLEIESLYDGEKYILSALDRYAEPTYITKLLINGNKLVHQAAVHYSGSWWLEGLDRYGDKLVMINGSTVEFVTTSGQVTAKYDLTAYGVNDQFVVEDYFGDVLFVRSYVNQTLLLVDLKEKKTYELYKFILDKADQKIVTDNIAYGGLYGGDRLTALGCRGDTFSFKHTQLAEPYEETRLTFTIPRKQK
ncbi:copper amine oxidase-like protein [Paenibacillus cellulosilyticus]|uniref:Copper amine oxidase-like protein n=1 Tax=Paenibacillus cellulosilyticus TaxID=375489 RepID=A0A2V2YQ00_9BACL|nr:copper amine oxidase N-terminal domain-containing protein [Paenibacillus cellulosilyticus]PWV98569.1 copper amine oxidase-like protein [Paenibacillus cellulosilyticus]QKS44173.1 copper amine oxidase N-terminal domain-containing protein [Paenibacillus cellulosilyticus]